MRDVQLICVGKLKESFYREACGEYSKRLSAYCRLTITELQEERLPQNPFPAQIQAALDREGAAILELSALVETWDHSPAKHLIFVIGGSYGLSETVKKAAQLRMSMSPMTFPHHLARVMLLEQIYRAFKIQEGSAYHK